MNTLLAYDHYIKKLGRVVSDPNEELPRGINIQRKEWVNLNQERVRVRTGENTKSCGLNPTSGHHRPRNTSLRVANLFLGHHHKSARVCNDIL